MRSVLGVWGRGTEGVGKSKGYEEMWEGVGERMECVWRVWEM